MASHFDRVRTAGLYATVGVIHAGRAFLSMPARHHVWRRTLANWLAGRVVRGMIEMYEANKMANGLARRAL
jgi:glucuronate isomerase